MTVLHDGAHLTNLSHIDIFPRKEEKHMLNKIKITNRTSRITENIVIKSLHNRTIFFKIKSIELIFKAGPILRSDFLDYFHVLVRMESCQSLFFGVHIVDFSEIIILRY